MIVATDCGGRFPARGTDLSQVEQDRSVVLDQFLLKHEQRAYRMALIATANHDDALDIVQDAMIKLVRGYANRDPAQWPALFTRIVQNTLTDWHRRNKIRKRWRQWFQRNEDEVAQEDPLEQVPQGGAHQPDEKLGHTEAIKQLDAALHALPLRQQQVFLLRQWEGLDVAQTAAAMNISQGSVKTHYSRALQRLRVELEDHW